MDDAAAGRLKFRVDKPAADDGFGVHGRIAKAIVEVVREQPEIKMIGLLGGWGSGKSTIVSLVKGTLATLDAETEIRCFVYDTWLRQSEPPRRAFLEGLIAFLAQPDQAAELDDEIEIEFAELLGHRESVDTETTFELTGPGKVMVILIALLPVALKLIGGGTIPKDVLLDFKVWPLEWFWPSALFVFGWTFTLAPFIALLWLCTAQKKSLSEVASLFARKPNERRRETRIRRPEPSAIEFQALFKKILEKQCIDPRNLLIVIDNLDRLPPDEAVTLWATMRGFFLDARGPVGADEDREALSKLPTVLVPIDPAAPGRIHREGAQAYDSSGTAVPAGGVTPSSDGKGSGLSQAFVDKTFDLVFHVPQPKLSGWQRYLEKRLKLVLREELEVDATLDVRVIYEAFQRKKGADAAVMPRDLNTFVNSVAALWMQHRGGEIRLATMAYFVCDRLRLTRDLHGALADPVVDLTPYDPDWRRGLASLAFGVDKDGADELYMKEPIRGAIEMNDAATFKALADEPGFDIYLDQILDDRTTVSVLAAARVLGSANLKATWVPRIWRRLRSAAPKHLETHPFTEGDDEGVAQIHAALAPDERLAFVQAMCPVLCQADPSRLLQHNGRYTADVAKRLVELGEADGAAELAIPLPGHGRVFALVVGHDLPPEVRNALRSQQSSDASISDAVAMVRDPELEQFRLGMRALTWFAQATLSSQVWAEAYEAVVAAFRSAEVERMIAGAKALVDLQRSLPLAQERIGTLQSEGAILGGIQRITEQPTDTAEADAAAAALIALAFQGGTKPEPPLGQEWREVLDRHPGLASHLDLALRDLMGNDSMAALWGLFTNHPRQAVLLRAVAHARLPRMDAEETAANAMGNLGGYLDLLHDADEFWRLLAARADFWNTASGLDLQISTPLFVRLIKVLENRSSLGRHLQSLLNSVEVGQWSTALETGLNPMPLIEALQALPQSKIEVGANLSSVLEAAVPSIAGNADGDRRTRWFKLTRWTEPSARKALLNKIGTSLVAETAKDPVQLLQAGGGLLSGPEGLGAMRLSGGILVPRLLARHDGISWLLAESSLVRRWVHKATPGDQSRIRTAIDSLADRRPADAQKLRNAWFPNLA
jgi:hypothetical protein